MTLPAGTTLGPYEVVAPLGAGGMGEVYRSRDTRLGRQVALKLLLPDFAGDDDRLRRFRQEAEAAGLLDHPNVLSVLDVGTHEGAPYVVSELLEGQTLRERMAEGPLPASVVRDYALQIADGLAAAHQRGIVHRDLKPENVFLTRDGVVKLLDFGLAKIGAAEPCASRPSARLTPPGPGSAPGLIVGTAAYMSPEQARGRPADSRSDIFAFGAVLYEMVTGERPFRGTSALETMAAVLREEPRWPALPLPLAAALVAVARRCLQKDPARRFASANELALALQAAGTALPATRPWPATRRAWTAAAVLLAAAGAAAGYVAALPRNDPAARGLQRLTFRRGVVSSARLAADGAVVYSADWDGQPGQLFVARPQAADARALDRGPAQLLALSSSGDMALLLRPRHVRGAVYTGTLARAPLATGAAQELLEGVQAADWSPDGAALAVVRDVEGSGRIEYPIGNLIYQTGGYPSHIRVAPDGERVAFIDHPLRSDGGGAVAVVDRLGHARTLSAGWQSIAGLAWSPSGREVWFTAARQGTRRALWAVGLDGRLRLIEQTLAALTLHDVAASRVLLSRDELRREMVGMAPGDSAERNLSWLDWSRSTHVSPDGRLVLFSEQGEGAGPLPAVFVRPLGGGPAVRLGDGIANEFSPDGRWALVVQPDDPAQLALLPVGAGQPRRITHDAIAHHWGTWLPSGRQVVFSGNQKGHGLRLYLQDVDGGAPRALTPEGVGTAWHPVSPDGTWVAAAAAGGIWLYPLDGGAPRRVEAALAGERPLRFTPDGRSLVVFAEGELPALVHAIDLASGRRRFLRRLMPQDPAGVTQIHPTFVAAEGGGHVYSYRRVLSELYLAEGLR